MSPKPSPQRWIAQPVLPGTPEDLRARRDELLDRRRRYNQASFTLGVPALFMLLAAPWFATDSPYFARGVAWLGVVFFCGAGAFIALYRGRHPAWGLLSLASLLLLVLLPDLNARRLYELSVQLRDPAAQRQRPRGELWYAWGLPLVPPLAPIGLIFGIAAVREAQHQKRSLVGPLLSVVWAGIMCCLVAALLLSVFGGAADERASGRSGESAGGESVVAGRYVRLRLPRGWRRLTEIELDAAVDLAVVDAANRLFLTAAVVSARDVAAVSLEEFAAKSMDVVRGNLPSLRVTRGPTWTSPAEIEYAFEGTADDLTLISYVKTFRRTDELFMSLTVWTTPSLMARQEQELRRLMASVEILN